MHHRKNCDSISHLAFRLENFRFSCKAQYAIRVSPDVHSNARRFFFVALRSQDRSPKESVLLPFSFLLLPYPRGDRPPGNVPDGMSKIKFRSFPQNATYYTKTAARESTKGRTGVYPFFGTARLAGEKSAATARRFSVEYRLGSKGSAFICAKALKLSCFVGF